MYAKTSEISKAFSFLVENGFKICKEDNQNTGAYIEYCGDKLRITLGFDYREYTFYFYVYLNNKMKYSDLEVGRNIIPFERLRECEFEDSELQPRADIGYSRALHNNVSVLKKNLPRLMKNAVN